MNKRHDDVLDAYCEADRNILNSLFRCLSLLTKHSFLSKFLTYFRSATVTSPTSLRE